MGDLWINLTDTIVEPTATFRRLRDRPMAVTAIAIFIVGMALSVVVDVQPDAAFDQFAMEMANEFQLDLSVDPVGIVWGLTVFALLALFTSTWILLFVGKAFGGTCTYRSLLSALGFAQLPSFFRVPILAFSGFIAPQLTLLGGFVVSVWGLILGVLAVRETMQVTTGQSVLALILTGIIFTIGLGLLGLVIAIIGIAIAAAVLP